MPLRFAFLPVRNFTLSPLTLFIDTLRLAGDEGDRSRRVEFDWQVLGEHGLPVTASSGLQLFPTAPIAAPESYDHVIVVGGLLRDQKLGQAAQAFLLEAARRGQPISALCTGSFVLAAHGLLDGYRACVSWFHIRDFRAQHPTVRAEADRLFLIDRNRATCAGGAGAADLASHFVAQALDERAAEKAAKILLFDRIRSGRDVQPGSDLFPDARSREVVRALLIMESNLAEEVPIPQIASRLGLSRRQIERRFRMELRASPAAAYLALRLRYAKTLIENSELPVEEIGFRCGFSNAGHFSRVFKQHFGLPPSRFRRATPDGV